MYAEKYAMCIFSVYFWALLSHWRQQAQAKAFCRTVFLSSLSPWHCNKDTLTNHATGSPSTLQRCRWSSLSRFSCNNQFWSGKILMQEYLELQKWLFAHLVWYGLNALNLSTARKCTFSEGMQLCMRSEYIPWIQTVTDPACTALWIKLW